MNELLYGPEGKGFCKPVVSIIVAAWQIMNRNVDFQ